MIEFLWYFLDFWGHFLFKFSLVLSRFVLFLKKFLSRFFFLIFYYLGVPLRSGYRSDRLWRSILLSLTQRGNKVEIVATISSLYLIFYPLLLRFSYRQMFFTLQISSLRMPFSDWVCCRASLTQSLPICNIVLRSAFFFVYLVVVEKSLIRKK